MAAIKMDQGNQGQGAGGEEEEIELIGFASKEVMRYVQTFMQAVYAMIPGVLVSSHYLLHLLPSQLYAHLADSNL